MIAEILEKSDEEIIEEEIKPLFCKIYNLEDELKHQAKFYKISTKRKLKKEIKSKKKEIFGLIEKLKNYQDTLQDNYNRGISLVYPIHDLMSYMPVCAEPKAFTSNIIKKGLFDELYNRFKI